MVLRKLYPSVDESVFACQKVTTLICAKKFYFFAENKFTKPMTHTLHHYYIVQSMFKKYLSWKPQEMVKVLLREVLFISFIVILLQQPSKAKGLLPLKEAFLDYASIKKYNLLPSRKRSILFDIDTLSLITDKVRLIFYKHM